MLNLTNFRKIYGGSQVPVLSIDNYTIGKGIYWIKGENGSGKTSLMKSVAGIIPFEGDISVAGINIHTNRMAYTRIVNYAEAEPKYPPFLSGQELIGLYQSAKPGKFPDELLVSLQVDKYMHQKLSTYSSGMLKKLSLLLAFIGDPVLVLLDEPLVALDVASVDILQAAIRQYSAAGVSFLITSHQPLDTSLVQEASTLVLSNMTLQNESI